MEFSQYKDYYGDLAEWPDQDVIESVEVYREWIAKSAQVEAAYPNAPHLWPKIVGWQAPSVIAMYAYFVGKFEAELQRRKA